MEITVTEEDVASYIKVDKDFNSSPQAHDYIYDMLTKTLHATILAAAQEQGQIDVMVQPPSFLDWLFKRTKQITVHYNIRQLMKKDKIRESLPIIEIMPQCYPIVVEDTLNNIRLHTNYHS